MLSRPRRGGGAASVALALLLPSVLFSALMARGISAAAALPPGGASPPIKQPPARPIPGKPGIYRLDQRLYLPAAKLVPGMKGYGLTVFHGAKIERFDVTVLGVLRKVNNGRDLILVRMGGNPNLSRVTDVIAGMSGSPVYVGGKIIGAVAYGSTFTRERIGYLTPIEDMLDAWDPALPQYPDGFGPHDRPSSADIGAPSGRSAAEDLAAPVTVDGRRFTRLRVAGPGEMPARGNGTDAGTLTLRPLATPVSVTGVPASRWSRVAQALARLGLEAQEGFGGGAAAAPGKSGKPALPASPLQPGGGIAMSLATGDLDMTGVGTLTFRAGNRIVAFGHPFLSIGPIDAPMSSVYIHDILPSYYESTKIGSPVNQVGAFTQDRPFSIAGQIGAKPVMVPVTVRINDRSTGRSRVFRCQIVRHPQLTRTLAPMAAGVAISEVHSQPGDAMATVRTTVTADEIGTITRVNRVYDPLAIDSAATADLDSLAGILSSNPFYPVPIRSVAMDVTIEDGRQTAQVERVFLDQTRYEPGDMVNVNVVLRPYKRPRIVQTIPVRIPPTVPDGSVLTIMVQGGASANGGLTLGVSETGGLVLQRAGADDYASAVNVRQLVRRFLDHERDDALIARLVLPTTAVSVQGERLTGLPPNIDSVLRGGTGSAGSRSSGARLERDEVRASTRTDYVVSGVQTLSIRVARRGSPETNGGTPSAPAAPSGQTAAPTATSQTIPAAPPRSAAVGSLRLTPADAFSGVRRLYTAQESGSGGDAPVTNTGVTVVHIGRRPASGGGGAKSAPGPAPTPAPVAAEPVAGAPVGRMPQIWRQASAAEFRSAALLDGVTVSSNGEVGLAPRLTRVAESVEDPYYWCLAEDPKGGVYAGTGDGGVIYRIAPSGVQVVYARTGELEVQSLAVAPDGTLYAGTAPHGYVFRIPPGGGAAAPLFQAPEKYVLALALSADGRSLYAGTGGPRARVWRVSLNGSGKPEPAYESAEGSVTALSVGPDGALYAGTAPSALIVRVAGPNTPRPTVLYDAAESAVTGLAVGRDGTVYAATMASGRGILYRIDGGTGAASILFDRAPEGTLTGLQRADDGTLYTASGGTLVAIRPFGVGDVDDADVRTFEAPGSADIQILSVLRGADGRVWASTGNTGGIYELLGGAGTPATGQIVSRVFDARAASKWGTIRWTASVPTGASVTLQTRTGDVPQPDASWSEWSRAYGTPTGDTIVSPAGRYLQYRATLTGQGADLPTLRAVEAFYLPPNQAPRLALVVPAGGEVWRGQKTLRWSATDPDRDTLSYEVTLSGDGGRTWRPIDNGAASLTTKTTVAPSPSVPSSGRAALEAELAKHPELTADMRARILADAPAEALSAPPALALAKEAGSGGAGTVTRDTGLTLDTTKLPDGVYLLKVVASDKPSNPDGALTAEKISGEFRVVNRAPTLVLLKSGLKINPDRTAVLEGVAMQQGAAIRAVQYRIDGGDWLAAAASDGLFDSTLEPFSLTTPPLKPVSHTLEVQTQDEAGNVATQKLTVR